MRPSLPTLRYAALSAAYWAVFCFAIAFTSVFLLARGLSNAQIGAVVAVSGLASAALQPLVAGAAARSRWPLRAWIVGLAGLLALVAAALMLPVATRLSDALLYGTALCLVQVVLPLVNAIGMEAAHAGVPVEFGPARAAGSLSFALASVGPGSLVAATDAMVIPPLLVAGQALLALTAVTFVFRVGRAAARVVATAAAADPAPLTRSGRRRFGVLLLGVTGCYTSHAAINTFLFQNLGHHGGDASHMGLAFLIAASVEVLPMLAFSRIVARWTPGTLLRVAAVMLAVKAVASLLAPNLTWFLATMLLQMVSFALLVPATVYYVDRLLPAAERVRGQAFMTLTLTLGNVIAGLGGGVLLDTAGVPALLLAGALAGGAAVVAVVAGTATRA